MSKNHHPPKCQAGNNVTLDLLDLEGLVIMPFQEEIRAGNLMVNYFLSIILSCLLFENSYFGPH